MQGVLGALAGGIVVALILVKQRHGPRGVVAAIAGGFVGMFLTGSIPAWLLPDEHAAWAFLGGLAGCYVGAAAAVRIAAGRLRSTFIR